MIDNEESVAAHATALCKSCGLCCTGHLFIWVKLKPSELGPAEKLGMTVYRSDPNQRGFSQPCPLWKGVCTIYHSPHYPRACRAYRCKLLKEVLAGDTPLPEALAVVDQAKRMISVLDAILPEKPGNNFRERLVAFIEHPPAPAGPENSILATRLKADALVLYYAQHFGVTDLFE